MSDAMRRPLKRALELTTHALVLGGVVALLAAAATWTPDPQPMTLRHRSDWWHSLIHAIPSERPHT